MRHYLKMELKRAFVNKKMAFVIAFGIFLSFWHYFAYIYPLRNYIFGKDYSYPLSAYNKWLGGEYFSLESTLFYLLIPILCALPYGNSWIYDCTSSIGGQAMIRKGKTAFIQTKMLVSFFSGAVIAMFPLLFDFALTCCTLPAITPKASLGLSFITNESLLGDLFYAQPLIYTLLYIGINGLFFGLLNTFSIVARLFTTNKYMAMLTPFLYYMTFHCVGTSTRHFELCPSGFLRPCQQFKTTWFILIAEILLMLIISILSAIHYVREEEGLL